MTQTRTADSSPRKIKASKKKVTVIVAPYRERLLRRVRTPHIIIGMLYQKGDNGKLSGRADGNVYMRNNRVRGMVVPALVQNDATSTQRSNFSTLSSAWNSLTEGQRKSWNVIGGYFYIDRFGNQKILAGKALFVALNRALFNIGVAQINTAPIPRAVIGSATLSITIDDSTPELILTFTPTPIPADNRWEVFATAPQSAGTFTPSQSAYRLITVLATGSVSGVDVYTDYSTKFGAPPIGSKVFVKVVGVNSISGQQSAAHIAFNTVVV